MRACSATTACNWTLSIPKLTKSPNQMTQMNPNDPIQGLQCRFACRMSLPPLLCICKLTFRANCSFLPLFWMGQARPGPVSSYLLLPAKDQSMSTPLIHDSSLQHQCFCPQSSLIGSFSHKERKSAKAMDLSCILFMSFPFFCAQFFLVKFFVQVCKSDLELPGLAYLRKRPFSFQSWIATLGPGTRLFGALE